MNRLLNPFIYGKPVPTGRFVGRQEQVRTIFSRLFNGESTAIVGEPHIGKSSLLNYITDEDTRREWIAQVFAQHVFVSFDAHLFDAAFTAEEFWRLALEELRLAPIADDGLRQQCDVVAQNNFGSFTLERLFRLLAKRSWRMVVLIDEFDTLLNHPAFNSAEFLGALRSFATRTNALSVITASRLSIAQMNRMSMEHNPLGSPFFNNMIEARLPQLNPAEADALIASTLQRTGNGVAFSDADRALVYTLAGRQPFLLQVAAASLFDALVEAPSGGSVHEAAEQLFYERAAAHFEDLTRTIEANQPGTLRVETKLDRVKLRQTMVATFSLSELELLSGDLEVDFEELEGDGKSAKALKLILFCERRGRLNDLVAKCRELRPDAEW